MDLASVMGILIGLFAIVGTQLIESNSIMAIIQPTAAFIVLGGTFGALFLNFSLPTIISAFSSAKKVFLDEEENTLEVVEQLMGLANLARQQGFLVLQEAIAGINDKFLKRGAQLVIDTTNPHLLNEILISEINLEEEQALIHARIFEAMGGYAPTFGIVGAVLGLIQVMGNLQDPSQLGHGIATAFVATLYGVGSANLIFLPIAGKLKMRLRGEILLKEMVVQGLISIQLGENPAILEEKLFTFLNFASRQNNLMTAFRSET